MHEVYRVSGVDGVNGVGWVHVVLGAHGVHREHARVSAHAQDYARAYICLCMSGYVYTSTFA